ncbi:MAG: hypothetical protein ACRD96_20395, partial [Bryobacteraceae bacterium]
HAITNLIFLTQDMHGGRTYPERWAAAWQSLLALKGPWGIRLFVTSGALSLLDPLGRLVFPALAGFYALWALLFSYETRNLAQALPFAALASACGIEWAVRQARRAPPWLLAVGAVAGIAWFQPRIVALLQESWWAELAPWVGVAVLGWWWVSREQTSFRFRVPLLAFLVAGALAVAGLRARFPDEVIISRQVELGRGIGNAPLNQRIYEYARLNPIRARIATNYFHFEFLPELGKYFHYVAVPNPATRDFLATLRSNRVAGHLLASDALFAEDVVDWMEASGYQTVVREAGWRLIRLPE